MPKRLSRLFVFGIALIVIGSVGRPATLLKDGAPIKVPTVGPEARQIDKNTIGAGDILFDTREKIFAAGRGFWPGGVLPYAFDATVSPAQQSAFLSACNAWTSGTPVTCRARTTEADYVLVRTHNGDGCAVVTSCSYVGRIGGRQYFSVLSSHWNIPEVIQHELGHAFGMIHEQQRPDRDSYIFVRQENVLPGYYYDIVVTEAARIVSDYDYVSIMHYSNCGGSKNPGACNMGTRDLWTLEPKPCGLDLVGGNVITALDRDGIRNAYAPAITALFAPKRSGDCGELTYGTDVVKQGCNGMCVDAQSQDTFNKVEHLSMGSCGGFLPLHWGEGQCVPLKKVEMNLNIHSSDFACGFAHSQTQHYAEATCGCAVSTIAAQCTLGADWHLPDYVSAEVVGSWRAGRVQYFNQVLTELKRENIATDEVIQTLPDFYFLNGADLKLESKLFRMRHKLSSYARWHKNENSSFTLGRDLFDTFAKREKLRTLGPGASPA